MFLIPEISPYASLISFAIGLPMTIATYYQAFKARQEARAEREGALHSLNCLEFVDDEGNCINLIPLETLHSMPKSGDIVLLPGGGRSAMVSNYPNAGAAEELGPERVYLPGAYRVEGIEFIFTPPERFSKRPQEARLTKTVVKVISLNSN